MKKKKKVGGRLWKGLKFKPSLKVTLKAMKPLKAFATEVRGTCRGLD